MESTATGPASVSGMAMMSYSRQQPLAAGRDSVGQNAGFFAQFSEGTNDQLLGFSAIIRQFGRQGEEQRSDVIVGGFDPMSAPTLELKAAGIKKRLG